MGLRGLFLSLALTSLSCGRDDYRSSLADEFKDNAQTNADVTADALELTFVDSTGRPLDLKQYRGQKHVVLVVTRGYQNMVCLFCCAQTSRLIANYDEFARRGAEVVVVFPGPKEHLPELLREARLQAGNEEVHFPVVLDENLDAVKRLRIEARLAKPSTYVIDRDGQVRFAYVGETASDRPSVKALLRVLDGLPRG
jgi:peroxiredoxin